MSDHENDDKDDEPAGTGAAHDQDKRLEELDEQVRAAAKQAEEAIREPGRTFHESGDEESKKEDDQTIAPPG